MIDEAQIQDALRRLVDPNTGKDFIAGRAARNVKLTSSWAIRAGASTIPSGAR
jgi:hypothetical protein